jgi:hypothetical protein
MANLPIRQIKQIIYFFDRILLRKTLSRVINQTLMKKTLANSFSTSTGEFPINFFLRSSELTTLADKYKTDKGGAPSQSKGPKATHSYTYFYEYLFSHCRNSITRVFECGIGTNFEDVASNMSSAGTPGASLRMWEEYFPNAEIIGVDIDNRVLFQTDRIKTFQLDQTSSKSIEDFKNHIGEPKFDLMIDDGLHTFDAAKNLFENIQPLLKVNGIYVIEDISPWNLNLYVNWLNSLKINFTVIPLFGMWKVPSDDLLIVIRNDKLT